MECLRQATLRGPQQVIRYLSAYTHRVGISPKRIVEVTDKQVAFTYRDPTRTQTKTMTLPGVEFARRFVQHVLPARFRKIRAYGWYRGQAFAQVGEQLRAWFRRRAHYAQLLAKLSSLVTPSAEEPPEPPRCQHCQVGRMHFVRPLLPVIEYGFR